MIKWYYIILIIVLLIIFFRIKRRGYLIRDRAGKKVSGKEFAVRFAKGLEGITPLQQTKTQLWGFPFIIGGTITGIIINLIHHVWWLMIILIGSLPIISMSLLSLYQKYKSLKRVEELMKQADEKEIKKAKRL